MTENTYVVCDPKTLAFFLFERQKPLSQTPDRIEISSYDGGDSDLLSHINASVSKRKANRVWPVRSQDFRPFYTTSTVRTGKMSTTNAASLIAHKRHL